MSSTPPVTPRSRNVPRLIALALLAVAFFFPFKLAVCPAWTATLLNEKAEPVPNCVVTESWQYYGVSAEASAEMTTDAQGRVTFPARSAYKSLGLLGVGRLFALLNVHASFGPEARLSSGREGYKWFNAYYRGKTNPPVDLWNVQAETTQASGGLDTKFHLEPIDLIDVVQNHDLAKVRQFLARDPAAIKFTDATGHTAMHWACLDPKDIGIAELLVARGADVNAATKEGTTPLHFAVDHCTLNAMTLLLDHGANANGAVHDSADPLKNGDTALHLMIPGWEDDAQKVAALNLLLGHGAEINRQNARGETPLFIAAYLGTPAVIRALLAAGADASLKTAEGKTPLAVADEVKKTENSAVLRELAANKH